MHLVTIKTCDSIQEAYLIKGSLENEGIKCFIQNEHIASLIPHYSGMMGAGVNLVINAKELSKAREILGVQDKAITCPNCGSMKYKFGFRKRYIPLFLVVIISLLSAMPFLNIKVKRVCSACGTEY